MYRVLIWNHEHRNKTFKYNDQAFDYCREMCKLGFLAHIEYKVGQRWFRLKEF